MRVKSLQQLLDEADRFLGAEATANAPQVKTAESLLAEELENASAITGLPSGDVGFEEDLIRLNKELAKIELESLCKVAGFIDSATSKGFSTEEIDEALEKVAAGETHKNLRELVALSMSTLQGEDVNSKRPTKKRHLGEEARRRPVTDSAGGAS